MLHEVLKLALPGSEELLTDVKRALGPERKPLLIAIDGADGLGKSSLASWLAWQLGMPAVYLDLHLVRDSKPFRWRSDEVARMIDGRLARNMPVVVEGVFMLDALAAVSRSPHYLIFVRGEGSHQLSSGLAEYNNRRQPMSLAAFCIDRFEE